MNIRIDSRVFTHNDDTEVRITVSSEYGGVQARTFDDPEAASEYIRDTVFEKYEEGLRKIEAKRSTLVAQLTKAQSTLERSGRA